MTHEQARGFAARATAHSVADRELRRTPEQWALLLVRDHQEAEQVLAVLREWEQAA